MEKHLARYVRYGRSEGHSPVTLHTAQQRVGLFMRFCADRNLPTSLDGLTIANVRAWIEQQQDDDLSPWTVNTRIRTLKAFSRWLAADEWLPIDPLARLKPPKATQQPKDVLTVKDVQRLLATCTGRNALRDKAIITLLFSTGIRAGELVALQRNDLDYDQGLVLIRKGKGGKFRVVPLGVAADKAIDKYLATRRDDLPNLFLTDDGLPLGMWTVRMMFRRKSALLGRSIYPHLLRHSFAVIYLRNGGSLPQLRLTMGHADYATTLWYAQLAGVDITADHDKADPMKGVKV